MDIGSLTEILTRLALGLGIGFVAGFTGIGAAVLVIPSLIMLGLPTITAVGTGALYAMLMRIFATYEHLKLGHVRKRTAFYISLGGVPLAVATAFLVLRLEKNMGSGIDTILKIVIGFVMLGTWVLMTISIVRSRKNTPEDYYVPVEHFPLRRKLHGLATGAGIGILLGATSVGGGVLIIPLLITVFKLSPQNTVGTSTMIAVMMSTATAITYLLGGSVNVAVALTMVIGAVPGVKPGCKLAAKIPHRSLEYVLFAVITISVIVMFTKITGEVYGMELISLPCSYDSQTWFVH